MRTLILAATLMASVARADDAPLVIAKLATRDDHARVVDAVCALRIPGVDVSLGGRRCAFGFADASAVPLAIRESPGAIVFEGRLDPELVRSARANVESRLLLGNAYQADAWVVSQWRPRSPGLREAGLIAMTFGGAAILVAPILAGGAYLAEHPFLCFTFFDPNPNACSRDGTPFVIAFAIDAIAGVAFLSFGATAFQVGRTKVAIVPDGVRVTF